MVRLLHGRFRVVMYRDTEDWRKRKPYKTVESDNLVLDDGGHLVAYLFSGGSIAAPGSTIGFDDTAQIGVSDKATEPDPADTDFDLAGGESEVFVTVAGVPVWDATARSLTYNAVFGAGVGSFVWKKVALMNSADHFFDISSPVVPSTVAKGATEVWEGFCIVYV